MLKKPGGFAPILPFLKKFGIVLALLLVYRLVLFFFNFNLFQGVTSYDFLIGTWFDLITLSLYLLPVVIIYFIPTPLKLKRWKQIANSILFVFISAGVLAFNAWDIAYYSYTFKRISYDYLLFMLNSTETNSLAGVFLLEFWWLFLLFLLSLTVLIWSERKFKSDSFAVDNWKSWLFYPVILAGFVIIGRGGFQLKPIGILDATIYTTVEKSPIVLNSAFTMIKTIEFRGVEPKHYFTEAEEKKYFNPIRVSTPQNILKDSSNVVFLLLESFGSAYVGPGNPDSYTPFLDSILNQSVYFSNGYANGRTSMDALPTILSSIPAWMDEPFILSSYSSNQFSGLPQILRKKGYETAFFHGATNGSMRFDSYCAATGIDHYFGRKEYKNEKHFDGNWGIWDHHMLNWSIDKMNEFKKPFFSMIFTLSSHHPFSIPSEYKSKIKMGPEPICGTLSYVDLALQEFFDKAKKQPWYKNTLFVICADHTGPTNRPEKATLDMRYRIPIAFFDPSGKLKPQKPTVSLQQIDIYPTILDLLNIQSKYYSIGSSYFSKQPKVIAAFAQQNLISFGSPGKPEVWNESKVYSKQNPKYWEIQHLKAAYQRYCRDLLSNKMLP
ncbi:MAG: LTA synthase family protein [Crocinitomicaceae bacterium]|nr:LTA synthase family protein [Crocinitomicaceae bacterium]MCF8410348.1 LTA synthase family protein [Crocinitomicaceae bacterium]